MANLRKLQQNSRLNGT